MTRPDGTIPLFNDAFDDVAPSTRALVAYAERLGFAQTPLPHGPMLALPDSGYYRWTGQGFDLWADVGRLGPDYLPGHAHADCLGFELFADGRAVVVDTGVSTYEAGPMRARERGTDAHNTVLIGDSDQAEMWGAFRVGRRPDVTVLRATESEISAEHNGYARLGVRHRRTFSFDDGGVTIVDNLYWDRPTGATAVAHIHFAPGIHAVISGTVISAGPIKIELRGAKAQWLEKCEIARGFGAREPALRLAADFSEALVTRIERCASSS
jgi:uncharacterized heparinase superfamily protein